MTLCLVKIFSYESPRRCRIHSALAEYIRHSFGTCSFKKKLFLTVPPKNKSIQKSQRVISAPLRGCRQSSVQIANKNILMLKKKCKKIRSHLHSRLVDIQYALTFFAHSGLYLGLMETFHHGKAHGGSFGHSKFILGLAAASQQPRQLGDFQTIF